MTGRARRGRRPPAGVCVGCGCTEGHACEGGCNWSDEDRRICTACVTIACRLADYLRANPPPPHPTATASRRGQA